MKRILWVVEKQFDVAQDTATWLEIIKNLQQYYVIQLLTGFKSERSQPHILKNNISYYHSVKIPVLNRLSTFIHQVYAFKKQYERFLPDIVIFNTSNPVLLRYAHKIRKKKQTKCILDIRTLPVSIGNMHRKIDSILLSRNLCYTARRYDGITYITKEMKRFCQEEFNLGSHRTAIWTSGVDTTLFKPQKTEIKSNGLRIIYHGTLSKKRGIDKVIKALSLVADLNISFEILGKAADSVDLRYLARKLGISSKVSFHDQISYENVPQWINKGDVGILPFHNWPAWNTSSPIKLFEYLSCGKPVIVSDIPAHKDVLGDGEFAFWGGTGSPEELAMAMKAAYGSRHDLKKYGVAAVELVSHKYTWERQAANLKAFIDSILTQ